MIREEGQIPKVNELVTLAKRKSESTSKAKDQMTSNERMAAYFDGKEVDRLPAMPMLESGCDIPVDAPLENIYAFMDAVMEYGPVRIGEKKL